MTLKVNPENTLVISQFGHKILFDGYLIKTKKLKNVFNLHSAFI